MRLNCLSALVLIDTRHGTASFLCRCWGLNCLSARVSIDTFEFETGKTVKSELSQSPFGSCVD